MRWLVEQIEKRGELVSVLEEFSIEKEKGVTRLRVRSKVLYDYVSGFVDKNAEPSIPPKGFKLPIRKLAKAIPIPRDEEGYTNICMAMELGQLFPPGYNGANLAWVLSPTLDKGVEFVIDKSGQLYSTDVLKRYWNLIVEGVKLLYEEQIGDYLLSGKVIGEPR